MKDKFIVGGGLSGLIFKYYNPDFTIIESKDLGGQATLDTGFKTVYLFDDEYTIKFLNDLDIKYEKQKLRIKYFSSGKIKNTATEEENAKYASKKLNHFMSKETKTKLKSDKMKPRQKENSVHLNVDMKEIIRKLTDNIEVINKKVILVDTKEKYITLSNFKKFHYAHLISTIPAPDFRYIAYNSKLNNKFNYLPGTFIISNSLPKIIESHKDEFDILYYVNDDMPFSRIWNHSNKFLYEIPGDATKYECDQYFEEIGVNIEAHFIRRVNFIFTEKIKKLKNITFLGRLACWDSNEFLSTGIKKAILFNKSKKI